jgi:hypothetical protein
MKTYIEVAKFVEELAAKYPQAGITFGYLGNVGHIGRTFVDDRSYYIFTTIQVAGLWRMERAKIFVGDASGFLTEQVHCFADGRPFDRKPTDEEGANKVVRDIEFSDIEARLVRLLSKVTA